MRIRFHNASNILWGVTVASVLLALVIAGIRLLPPRERVTVVFGEKPWITLDPVRSQGNPVPFGDRDHPDLLYLVYLHGDNRAIKVDLNVRSTAPIQFRDEGKDVPRIAQYDLGGPHLFNMTPLKWQFQGTVESHEVYHVFGSPLPNAPTTRTALLRTGTWSLVDTRNGQPMELLRFEVRNSERKEDDFGDLYISLNSRWIVFIDASFSSKIYVFRRDR
jgi:hypothetical protein